MTVTGINETKYNRWQQNHVHLKISHKTYIIPIFLMKPKGMEYEMFVNQKEV
jgi:hypothetical protein